ncbi:MAG TPA: two-component regulator propeller domain-containing protein [Rhodanobacteraceae bacterium]
MGSWRQGWVGKATLARWAAFALACLMTGIASAVTLPGATNMRFRNYSVAQGLPQATVTAIVQDAQGFLWMGTQDGLARFDGYEFLAFQHHRHVANSLADNFVTALATDPRGGVWIGTQVGGLDHFNPATGKFTHYRADHGRPGTLASDTVAALAMDARGRLWIASLGAKLQWIERGSTEIHTAPFGARAPLGSVHALLPLADGSLLIGTGAGLWQANPQGTELRLWGHDPRVAALDVYALTIGPHGDLWVGTDNSGLYDFAANGTLKRHFQHAAHDPASLPDDQIRALAFDHSGRLWIAGNAAGLALLNPAAGTFAHFTHNAADPQSVAANRLWSLLVDRDGLVVVGSWANGFSIHDPRGEILTQLSSIPGDPSTLPGPSASSVYGDADGSLWIGMLQNGGLLHFDFNRGVFARYTHNPDDPASLAGDSVVYVTRTPDGSLWVATLGDGLDRMQANGKGFEHLSHDPSDPTSLGSNLVRYVYQDRNGTLWVGTKVAGLDERCAGCTGFVHHRPGNGPDTVNDIAAIDVGHVLETRDGAIWAATQSNGLYRRAKGAKRFVNIRATAANGLSSNLISTIFQARNGDLWIGTSGGGLDRLKGANLRNHFETIDSSDGLASDSIGEILEDAHGDIWVSTLKGISRIDPNTLAVRNFGATDSATELGYWINSGTLLADGRLAFGGLNGVTVVDPAAPSRLPPARPAITAVVLHGQRYALHAALPGGAQWRDGVLTLTHNQDDFGAEFASLDYASPQLTQYAYRLNGYNHGWVNASANRRVAFYTNLAPGTYQLQVRARHEGGPWSATPATITFRLLPAPWLSPLAILAYLLGVVILLLLFGWRIRLNLRRRRASRHALQRSSERLKLALWGSGSEMFDIDLTDGSVHRENRLPNIAASSEAKDQTLLGYRPFLHPDDIAPFEAALRDHLHGSTESFEASYRTLDTEHHWVWLLSRARVVQRNAEGRALRISGTTSDITALKQAEDALRKLNETLESRVEQRTHELRSVNTELRGLLNQLTRAQHQLVESEKLASLGSLVAGVAHEINTPLGIGVTAASYLHDEATRLAGALAAGAASPQELGASCARISEGADLILRNLRRADQLVKSFKQVAVDQTGGDVREIDLGKCIADVVATLQPSLRRGHHTVTLDCADQIMLRSSPGALGQVITNLAINSVTHGFTPDKPGHITITARRAANGVVLDYRDDGVGMTPEVRARTFEPFFTTRRGQGGTGLGMHIVYTLVTRVLHGTVELESTPGAGVHVRMMFASLDAPRDPAPTT